MEAGGFGGRHDLRVQVALYAARAALDPLLGVDSFLVDWYGRTSSGKTTTLRVGGSAWGNPGPAHGRVDHPPLEHDWRLRGAGSGHDDGSPASAGRHESGARQASPQDNLSSRRRPGPWARQRGQRRRDGHVADRRAVHRREAGRVKFSNDGGTRGRVLEIGGSPFDDDQARQVVQTLARELAQHHGHAGTCCPLAEGQCVPWPNPARIGHPMMTPLGAATRGRASGGLCCGHRRGRRSWSMRRWSCRGSSAAGLWDDIIGYAADATGVEEALRTVFAWACANEGRFFGPRRLVGCRSRLCRRRAAGALADGTPVKLDGAGDHAVRATAPSPERGGQGARRSAPRVAGARMAGTRLGEGRLHEALPDRLADARPPLVAIKREAIDQVNGGTA